MPLSDARGSLRLAPWVLWTHCLASSQACCQRGFSVSCDMLPTLGRDLSSFDLDCLVALAATLSSLDSWAIEFHLPYIFRKHILSVCCMP